MINNATPAARVPTVGMVAAHFNKTELVEGANRRSWSTRTNYLNNLNLYVLPRWENTRMMDVKGVDVEAWLADLQGKRTKRPLENPTKLRIKNVLSVVFSHAQRYEFVQIGHNPIKLVRQSGKRASIPDILTAFASEIHGVWYGSGERERRCDLTGVWQRAPHQRGHRSEVERYRFPEGDRLRRTCCCQQPRR